MRANNKIMGFLANIALSKQRRYIFIFSIILALVLLALAAGFSGSPLHVTTTNLAINFASSLFTVAVTVTVIDHLIRSEFRFRTAPVYISGIRAINSIVNQLEMALAHLYGYDVRQSKIKYDSNDVINYTQKLHDWYGDCIQEIQSTPNLDPDKINRKIYKPFYKVLMDSNKEMDSFLKIYTYVMPDNLMEPVIKLRDDIDRTKRALEQAGDVVPKDLQAFMMFTWKLSVSVGELREALGNNPTHNASQNYLKLRYGRRKINKLETK